MHIRIFVHGFNVDEKESANWQDRMFKRLYRTGINCRFVNVDWNGDGWMPYCYALNVVNAFKTAPYLEKLCTRLKTDLDTGGASSGCRLFIMAHSLGNMDVSSAIQDYGMKPDSYFMLNAENT